MHDGLVLMYKVVRMLRLVWARGAAGAAVICYMWTFLSRFVTLRRSFASIYVGFTSAILLTNSIP
jgi:hypothetical protein